MPESEDAADPKGTSIDDYKTKKAKGRPIRGCISYLNYHNHPVLNDDQKHLDLSEDDRELLARYKNWRLLKTITMVERNAFKTLEAEDQYNSLQKYWKTLSIIAVLFALLSTNNYSDPPLDESGKPDWNVGFYAGMTILSGITTSLLCVIFKAFLCSLPQKCGPNFVKEFTVFLPLPMVGIVLTILAYVMGFLSIGFGVYGRDNMTWFRLAGAFACLLVLFVLFRLVNGSRSIAEVASETKVRDNKDKASKVMGIVEEEDGTEVRFRFETWDRNSTKAKEYIEKNSLTKS